MKRDAFELYEKLMRARDEVGEVSCMSFPDAFFPELNEEISVTRWAKQACKSCPIRDLCLEYAVVAKEEHGIWGGTSPRERQQLRSRGRVA